MSTTDPQAHPNAELADEAWAKLSRCLKYAQFQRDDIKGTYALPTADELGALYTLIDLSEKATIDVFDTYQTEVIRAVDSVRDKNLQLVHQRITRSPSVLLEVFMGALGALVPIMVGSIVGRLAATGNVASGSAPRPPLRTNYKNA